MVGNEDAERGSLHGRPRFMQGERNRKQGKLKEKIITGVTRMEAGRPSDAIKTGRKKCSER